jgi:hypothetical protein
MKPVGYYVSSDDSTLIDEMVDYFGNQFQNMTPTEKCWLLYRIGFHLWMHDADGEGVRDEVENAMSRIEQELSAPERLSLMDALVNQLKVTLRHML